MALRKNKDAKAARVMRAAQRAGRKSVSRMKGSTAARRSQVPVSDLRSQYRGSPHNPL